MSYMLLGIPHLAKIIRDIIIGIVIIIFMLMLYFGFSRFFIPLLLTAMVLIGLVVTRAWQYTNPVILVMMIPLTFAIGYGLEKLTLVNPALQQAVSVPEPSIKLVIIGLVILLAILLYIYRCTIFGICKR